MSAPLPIRHLDLQLTHRCNLRCSYCYAGRQTDQLAADIKPDWAAAAIDFLFEQSQDVPEMHLNLWGGEPFLAMDLVEHVSALARAKERSTGRKVTINAATNVTVLDSSARRLIREYDLGISLSLDGGPDAHTDRVLASGQSAWPLIERRLDELVAESDGRLPPVRMTVTPQRAGRLAADVLYLHRRGFRQVSFLPVSGVVWTDRAAERFEEQSDRVADRLISSIRQGSNFPPYYPPLLRRLTMLWVEAQTGVRPRRAGNCGAGSSLVAVDTRGDLYPCHRFVTRRSPPSELKLGSLDAGITNIDLRDRLARVSLDSSGVRCATCPGRVDCLGLCVAYNLQVTGNIAGVPDQACFLNRSLARCAARIHRALSEERRYRDYLEPFLHADPDERKLPFLAALEANAERLVDQLSDEKTEDA